MEYSRCGISGYPTLYAADAVGYDHMRETEVVRQARAWTPFRATHVLLATPSEREADDAEDDMDGRADEDGYPLYA